MTSFGAFGKIPDLGDFFRHNLSSGFVQAWDSWLQGAMVDSKSALGPGWDDAYMSAPIWRFTLPPGIAGASAMSGILMASVDRVGRQYPLTLVTAHDPADLPLTHFANRTVFEALEDLALQMLDDTGRRDTLLAALDTMALEVPASMGAVGQGGLPYAGPLPPDQVLAAQALAQQHPGASIWSTMMDHGFRLMACPALPAAAQARALFDVNAPYWRGGGAPSAALNDPHGANLPPPLDDPIADLLGDGGDL